MQTIPSIPGKMFYIAHKLYKEQKISLKQKGLFKDLIIAGSKQLIVAYQIYLKEGTELTFTSNLIKILHKHKHHQSFDQSSESSSKNRQNIRARRHQLKISNIKIPPKNIQKFSKMPDRI